MFEGKEFCVVNAPKELSKQEMEQKIVEVRKSELFLSLFLSVHENTLKFQQHGGTFVQNPGPDTFCVLVNKVIVRASSIIRLSESYSTVVYSYY